LADFLSLSSTNGTNGSSFDQQENIKMEKENKMKANASSAAERNQRRMLEQISRQVEMAFASENVSGDVKECLKTIILDASIQADMCLSDFTLVRAALPNIIKKLGADYGRGYLHAISAIIEHNTDAFQKFHDEKLDQDAEDLASLLSQVIKHPKMPTRLLHVMADELCETPSDWRAPENILFNLQEMGKAEVTNEK
jgi:hypothetical protein